MCEAPSESYGLVICNKWPREPVFLDKLVVKAVLIDNNAGVTCNFFYKNTTSEMIETEFIFPLESTAAVYHLEAVIGKKRLIAHCRERVEAESTYSEAVERGHTAFMMQEDFHMGDTFKMKLGNIPAGDRIDLTFKYVLPLYLREVDTSLKRFKALEEPFVYVLSIPGKLGNRYGGDIPASKLAAKMKFSAEIYAVGGVLSVTSAHQNFNVEIVDRAKTHAKVSMKEDMDLVRDFELELALQNPHIFSSPCEMGNPSKGGFLGMHCVTASFLPSIPQTEANDGYKYEIIFVLDRSGSMSGSRIEKSKEALLLFLKSLPRKCRFQIVSFGSHHSSLFPQPVDYTEENVMQALSHQAHLEADLGGTNLYPALKSVYDTPLTGEGWYRQIVLLTDGEIFEQEPVIGLVMKNRSNARLFAIGLGNEVSTSLIWGVARAGRGAATFIRDADNLRVGVMSVLRAILQPMLKDVSLEWDVKVDGKKPEILVVPSQLPPLFAHHFMTTHGLIVPSTGDSSNSKVEGTLTLSYTFNDEVCKQTSTIQNLPMAHEELGLHRVAAKAQLFELADKYSSLSEEGKKEAENIRQQIIDISINTNVISRFTAFVGVDPDKTENFVRPPPAPPQARETAVAHGLFTGASLNKSCSYGGGVRFCKAKRAIVLAPQAECVTFDACNDSGDSAPMTMVPRVAPGVTGVHHKEARGSSMFMPECEEAVEEALQPEDDVVRAAKLQEFNGFWNLNKGIAELLHVQLAKLSSSKPTEVKSNKVWATVLVIAYLRSHLGSKKDEWEMLVMKAIDWLESDQGCSDVEALIQMAEGVLNKLALK